MTKHRPHRYTKKDNNHNQIVKELRSLGFDVDDVSAVPGIYDILVSGQKYPIVVNGKGFYRCDCSVRVEIKTPQGVVYPSEIKYYDRQNHKGSYIIARSTEDVLEWFK